MTVQGRESPDRAAWDRCSLIRLRLLMIYVSYMEDIDVILTQSCSLADMQF